MLMLAASIAKSCLTRSRPRRRARRPPCSRRIKWCREIAAERRVPDAKEKTVAEAFLEEKPAMVALAYDDFPAR